MGKLARTGVILTLGLILACYLQNAIASEGVMQFWNLSLIPLLIYCPLLYFLAWKAYSRFLADLNGIDESYASAIDFYSYLPTLLLLQYFYLPKRPEDLLEQYLLELTFFCICATKAAQFGFLLFKTKKFALRAFLRPLTLGLLLLIAIVTFLFIRSYDYLLYKTIEPRLIVKPRKEIVINNELRRVLYSPSPYLPRSNKIVRETTLPENARMSFGIGIGRNSWFQSETGVEFLILIRSNGHEETVFSRYINPLNNPAERGWIDEKIDLSKYSGQKVTIVFETEVKYSVIDSLRKTLKSSFGVTQWYNIGKYGNIVEAVWSEPKIYSEGNQDGQNVILISFDTLSAMHLGCYGYEFKTTPHLDQFAFEGVLFKRCVAQSAWTLPSHMSLFTGQNCSTHGIVTDESGRLDDSFVTMAEAFQDQGYQTAAVTEGGNVNSAFGFAHGFESYDNGGRSNIEQTFSKVYRWLEQRRTGKFFLFVHTYETHSSYTKNEPYYSSFGLHYNGLIRGNQRFLAKATSWPYYLRNEDMAELRALYDSEVANADAHFNQLIDKLETLGLADNTTVIVTSDHGEGFGEHLYFGHGNTLYDELLLVPLIMKGPHLPKGLVVEQQVRSVDIMPTLLELHQIPVPDGLDGVSLLPLLNGQHLQVPPAITEVDSVAYGPPKKSIRTDRMKMILIGNSNQSELYDLGHDPQEKIDLSRNQDLTAGELEDQLLASVQISKEKNSRIVRRKPEEIEMTESVKDQLEALGYIR